MVLYDVHFLGSVLNLYDPRTTDVLIIGDLETESPEGQKATGQMGRMIMNYNSDRFG